MEHHTRELGIPPRKRYRESIPRKAKDPPPAPANNKTTITPLAATTTDTYYLVFLFESVLHQRDGELDIETEADGETEVPTGTPSGEAEIETPLDGDDDAGCWILLRNVDVVPRAILESDYISPTLLDELRDSWRRYWRQSTSNGYHRLDAPAVHEEHWTVVAVGSDMGDFDALQTSYSAVFPMCHVCVTRTDDGRAIGPQATTEEKDEMEGDPSLYIQSHLLFSARYGWLEFRPNPRLPCATLMFLTELMVDVLYAPKKEEYTIAIEDLFWKWIPCTDGADGMVINPIETTPRCIGDIMHGIRLDNVLVNPALHTKSIQRVPIRDLGWVCKPKHNTYSMDRIHLLQYDLSLPPAWAPML